MAIIGSARVDENGKYTNGKPGDQKQVANPDYKGEVSKQKFYVSPKGWWILRAINMFVAIKIAHAMSVACDNPNVGYSQNNRYGVVKDGTASKTKTNGDCSSLVRRCIIEGAGVDPGDFNTANEVEKIMATRLFNKIDYGYGVKLVTGDILVTKTKGHTVIVVEGDEDHKTDEEIAREVIAGKWGTGTDRMNRLHAAGYDYAVIQAIVNSILKEG